MSNPHRIDPLAPPPPQKPRPSSSPFKVWALRVGVTLLGAGLGASCPFWPPAVQPVCRIVSTVVQGASSTLPAPAEPERPDDET